MSGIAAFATVPFLLHIFTAVAVMVDARFQDAQKDSLSWWLEAGIESYRLGPRVGTIALYVAVIQLSLTCVAIVTHFIGGLQWRKICYGILTTFYAVTQLRHCIWNEGVSIIGYLYIHIAVFAILVLYQDSWKKSKCLKSE